MHCGTHVDVSQVWQWCLHWTHIRELSHWTFYRSADPVVTDLTQYAGRSKPNECGPQCVLIPNCDCYHSHSWIGLLYVFVSVLRTGVENTADKISSDVNYYTEHTRRIVIGSHAQRTRALFINTSGSTQNMLISGQAFFVFGSHSLRLDLDWFLESAWKLDA